MGIPNLRLTRTSFRRGYKQQEVDQLLDLVAANLALPLAERTLRAEDVTAVCFTSTMFRAGYDEHEVDNALEELSVELGLPSASEFQDDAEPTAPPLQPTPGSVPSALETQHLPAAEATDDFRPDPTF